MSDPERNEELELRKVTRPLAVLVGLQAALLLVLLSVPGAAQTASEASAARPLVPLAALPRAVSSFGACELDGWLYVAGGHGGRTHQYGESAQWGGFARTRFDAPGAWEELAGGEKLQGTALVAVAGRVVRVGGLAVRGEGQEATMTSLARVLAFDPARGTASELAPLPEPRSSHDAIAVGTRLVVLGGWALHGNKDEVAWAERGFVLDLAREGTGWSELAQPFSERGLALASDGREAFVLGGMDEAGDFSRAVRALEPVRGAWRELPALPCDGFGLAAACVAGELVVSGRDGRVWKLAPGAAAWRDAGALAFPRGFHRLVARGRELLVLGGSAASEPVAWLERVTAEAPPRALTAVAFPGRARQRQALFVDGARIGLLGGNVALEQHAFTADDFLAETWSLALGSGALESLAPLPTPRQSMVCVTLPDGDVLALGGFGHDGTKDRTFDSIWRLAQADGRWSELTARLPRDLTQFRAFVHGGELWLVGGMNFDRAREKKMELSDVIWKAQLAALEHGFVDSGLRLPAPRRAFGAALVDGKIYLAGGLDTGFDAVAGLDVLELATGTWTKLAAPSTERLSPELVALDGKLYLAAGLAYDAELDTRAVPLIEEYDPARDAWRSLATPLPLAPEEVQAFAWNGRLGFVSTWNERGVLELAFLAPR